MAYRRPLSPIQSAIIALLWIILIVWVLLKNPFDVFTLVLLLFSAITVFYPIYKSYKQRNKD